MVAALGNPGYSNPWNRNNRRPDLGCGFLSVKENEPLDPLTVGVLSPETDVLADSTHPFLLNLDSRRDCGKNPIRSAARMPGVKDENKNHEEPLGSSCDYSADPDLRGCRSGDRVALPDVRLHRAPPCSTGRCD